MLGITNPGGLANWHAALQSRYYAPAKVLVISDSTGETTGATAYSDRWPYVLQTLLRSGHPTPGVNAGGLGYVPSMVALPPPPPVTLTGSPTQHLHDYGMGGKSIELQSGKAAEWASTTCDRVVVWYSLDPFGLTADVKIDGAVVATLSSNGGPAAATPWVSSALTRAAHTVRLEGKTGFSFFIDAVEFFDGDYGKGVHVYDGAHAGYGTGSYNSAFMDRGHWSSVAKLKPNLVIVALGINDWDVVAPATHGTQLDTILTKVATACGSTPYSVLVASQYRPGIAKTRANWDGIVAADRARATGNVAHVSIQEEWPDLEVSGVTSQGLMYESSSPIHPSTAGHARIASKLSEVLRLPVESNTQTRLARSIVRLP